MLIKSASLLLLLSFSQSLFASARTDQDWLDSLARQKLNENEQAYCYTGAHGERLGKNLNLKVRLASVSKLVTSLWAIEALSPQHKYLTKLFLNENNLHIQGSYDPFFGNEKMFFLLSELNKRGIKKFDRLTFDKELIVFPNAQGYVENYPVLNKETNIKYLSMYFNTKTWSQAMQNEYARIAALSKGKMNKTVEFEVESVAFSENNPYADKKEETKTLTLSSPQLYKYLKEMNVESNNYVAHTLFLQLGGEREFMKFVDDRFSLTSNDIYFWTGSGLPSTVDGQRRDNYATCSIIMSFVSALKESSERQGRELKDIVAVPGSDAGTFKNRIFPSDYKNAFMAKSGTLMHTSALAGAMNTQSGFNYYGVFNQSTNLTGSKIVQNEMVKSIMTEMGGPKVFDYKVGDFNTYEDVKKRETPSEYLPFEEGLY